MTTYSDAARKFLGLQVRTQREHAHISPEDLAAKMGRSKRQLLALERGEQVGDATIARAEQALGWPVGRAHMLMTAYEAPFAPQPLIETVGSPDEADDFVPTGDGPTGVSDDAVIARLEQIQREIADMIRERRGGGTT